MLSHLLAGTERAPMPVIGRTPTVLVFDSGLGGLTVFREIRAARPDASFVYLADDAAFPYGALSENELCNRVVLVLGEAISAVAPDVVVIACNTASTLVLPVLRRRFDIPFVGTVPAVKPAAAASRSKLISVLATPGTVARDYTRELIASYAGDCRVTLVGSVGLAALAEADFTGVPVADDEVAAEIAPCFVRDGRARTDTVVLACTHYPLLAARLRRLAPWPVTWVDPAPAIARRVTQILGDPSASSFAPAGDEPIAMFTDGGRLDPRLRAALAALGLGRVRTRIAPLPGVTSLT